MKHLVSSAAAAGVRTEVQSRCDALVTGSDGSVVGAILSTLEGEKAIRVRKGVILAAGGFIWNKEMLARYAPVLARCKYKVGTETDDGLGIRLGLAAGGEAIRMDAGDITMSLFPPNDLRRGIFVGTEGQRFMNEDVYMGRAGEFVMFRQAGEAYLIVDDDCFARPEFIPVELAGVGDTIEELEGELGMPPGALTQTVDYYNEHASRGEDPLFHKSRDFVTPLDSPPFGALDLRAEHYAYAALTLGGLWTSPHGEVRNSAGEPIPGLYAAGRTTSGIAKQGYGSGMSLGDCSFFGRRSGRHAAQQTNAG
jgi:3-oxo-5alpha-steroid 4-dehydrogenase